MRLDLHTCEKDNVTWTPTYTFFS